MLFIMVFKMASSLWFEFALMVSLFGNVITLGYIFSYRHVFGASEFKKVEPDYSHMTINEMMNNDLLIEATRELNRREIKTRFEVK